MPSSYTLTQRRALAGQTLSAHVAAEFIGVMFLGSTLLTPLYILYRQAFGFSEMTLTLIYATYVIGNLGALFFFGRLSDQIGRRRASLPALALGAIATLVFLFARDTVWLFIARILSGFAIGIASGTATAWVAEYVPSGDKPRASALATTANLVGLGVGPLISGLLAQFAPAPLHTSFVAYLILIGVVAWQVSKLDETVPRPVTRLADASFRPRLGVPRDIRAAFVAPAVAGFATFALVGYYAALVPSLLAEDLGFRSSALAGAVVAALFIVAAVAVQATRRLTSRTAMLAGLGLLLPSLVFLALAEPLGSLSVLLMGTMTGGVAGALGYRGTLQVVNRIAPKDRRAEVLSSYLIACYLGNSLPVIGVGVLSMLWGHALAYAIFAATIAVLAVIALITGWRYAPRGA
jgi:MFS family permease